MCAPKGLRTGLSLLNVSLNCFVLPFFKWFITVFQLIAIPFQKRSQTFGARLRLSTPYMIVLVIWITTTIMASGNNQEWKMKCRKFTKCCPETATCYKYYLNSIPTNKICDGVLEIYGNRIPSTFTCKVIGCTQNSNSRKTGRYHKKVVATLNPNSQRILIFCKFLRCIDSKMIALNFLSLQPKNN